MNEPFGRYVPMTPENNVVEKKKESFWIDLCILLVIAFFFFPSLFGKRTKS